MAEQPGVPETSALESAAEAAEAAGTAAGQASSMAEASTAAADLARYREEALKRVRTLLRGLEVPESEIDQAERDDVLDLLVVDRMLFPPGPRYSRTDLAERSGISPDLLRRIWRALGFSDVEGEERAFGELDLEALQLFKMLLEAGAVELQAAIQLARVIGSSMARIAEAEVIPRAFLNPSNAEDSVFAADAFSNMAGPTLTSSGKLLEFVWRRHMQAAAHRGMLQRARGRVSGLGTTLAVGFADMVGFTVLSQHLSDEELMARVQRFEDLSHDVVTRMTGRVVKLIGDEAMFVAENPEVAVEIGLELAATFDQAELLSDVRVGLAFGPVLVREGDYYGLTVNLAHRITGLARPGTVLLSKGMWEAVTGRSVSEPGHSGEPPRFSARPLRPRALKDFGRVPLWLAQRVESEEPKSARRLEATKEYVSELLRDLDELRERGERLFSSGYHAATAVGSSPDTESQNDGRSDSPGDRENAP